MGCSTCTRVRARTLRFMRIASERLNQIRQLGVEATQVEADSKPASDVLLNKSVRQQ